MFSRLLLELILLWLTVSTADAHAPMATHVCKDSCGNVSIPYPFGIGPNCFHDPWFEIVCNTSLSPNKPFLNKFNLEVINLGFGGPYDQSIVVGIPGQKICADSKQSISSIDLRPSPYRFDGWRNVFVVEALEGCGGRVGLMNRSKDILVSYASVCPGSNASSDTNCYDSFAYCCHSVYSRHLDYYEVGFVHDEEAVPDQPHTCVLAGLAVNSLSGTLLSEDLFPTALAWVVRDLGIRNSSSCQCSDCDPNMAAYTTGQGDDWVNGSTCCECINGYEGNPYSPNGCHVIKGCEKCLGTSAFYEAYCDREANGTYMCYPPIHISHTGMATILGVCIGAGSILMLLCCYWLYRAIKRRKVAKQKAKFFKRNGGKLLQQQMTTNEGMAEKTMIFTINELEKATDNFNDNRILGQGGQGTVYKGMLIDSRIVAIKKSKQVDGHQLEQFINEVVILSQINHRNVVKLLGCCLETEVPLLVYEFIPNGTLARHIHDSSEEFQLTWNMRLKIAAETAGALGYLHSSSSSPIYHRDIKSSNILLDDKYRAKVSDFGTSRTINIDQTHLTTFVKGTFGYFDPEYFQTNQFTEKSDVYSFGVVLVELLTSKKPIFQIQPNEWRSLATEFLSVMEAFHFLDIVDEDVLREGKEEELWAVADLAKECLNSNGKLRPTMKQVATLLEGIGSTHLPTTPAEQNFLYGSVSEAADTCEVISAPLCLSADTSEERISCWIDSPPLMSNTV